MTKPILLYLDPIVLNLCRPPFSRATHALDLVGSSHLPCFPLRLHVPLANDFRVETYCWIPIRFGERLRIPVDRLSCRKLFDSAATCVTLIRMNPEALPLAFNRRVNTHVFYQMGPYPSFLVRPIYDFRLLHLPAAPALDKLSAA